MKKNKAEIVLKISLESLVEEDDEKRLNAVVEYKGSSNEVMELAEVAQHIKMIGEACVDKLLICVLNDEGDCINIGKGILH